MRLTIQECLMIIFSTLVLRCSGTPYLVDLSYTYSKNTPNHPQLTKFDLRVVKRGLNKYGNWVEMNDIFTSEHSGTHMDAPAHYSRGGKTVDQIMPGNIYRVPGIKIDVSKKTVFADNYEIQPSDIKEWIASYGNIPDGAVVMFETGWGRKAYSPSAYSGLDQYGKLNFPGIGREAADFLVRYGNMTLQSKGIVGVGIDTISLDVGQSARLPAHLTLLGAGIYGLENVANLDKLPAKGFTLTLLPMKIGTGSGSPTRILAEVEGMSYAEALISLAPSLTASFYSIYCIILIPLIAFRVN